MRGCSRSGISSSRATSLADSVAALIPSQGQEAWAAFPVTSILTSTLPTEPSAGRSHAFLYMGGQMFDLGTLGGAESYGYRINDLGIVVGLKPASVGATGLKHQGGQSGRQQSESHDALL